MDKPLVGAHRALPHVALVFAQLSFSGWHILGQMAFRGGAHPVVVALYRELLSTALMFLCVYYLNRGRGLRGNLRMISEVFNGEDRKQFLLIGVTSFINMIASILGLHFTNAALFALFQPIVPVVATILSIVQGFEGYSHLKIVGICLGIAGALIVETAGHSQDDGKDKKASEEDVDIVYYIGLCFIFAQVTACATFLTMQKGIASKYDSIIITFIYYLVATTMTVLLAGLMGLLGYLDADDMTFSGNDVYTAWIAIIYVSFVATVYAWNAFSWASKYLSPSVSTLYMSLQPVATTLLAYYLFDEDIQTAQCVGATSIIAGMFVTVYAQNEASLAVSGGNGGFDVQAVVCGGCIWLQRVALGDKKTEEEPTVVYQQLKALVT